MSALPSLTHALSHSTYNYGGQLYNRLLSAFQRRDIEAARLEQRRSQALIKLLRKYGTEPATCMASPSV